MPLNPNPTVVKTNRRVTLLNDPYVNPLNNLLWTTGQDNRGFQYQIALDALPAGVTPDMIEQGQVWFVENTSTAYRLSMYVGQISVSTIQGVTISGVPQPGQVLAAISASGATWVTASGGGSGGITQLTGDILAGPGSGTQVSTLQATTNVERIISNNSSLVSISGSLSTISGITYQNQANISTISGSLVTISGVAFAASGMAYTISGYVSTLSGYTYGSLTTSVNTISGALVSVSGVAYAAVPLTGGTVGPLTVSGGLTVSGTTTISGKNNLFGPTTITGTGNYLTVDTNAIYPTYNMPANYGIANNYIKAWTVDPLFATASLTMVTGTAYYSSIWIPQPMTVSGIGAYNVGIGFSGIISVALFNGSNNQQVAVISTSFGGSPSVYSRAAISGGNYSITAPGLYYIGIVASGTGSPTIAATPAVASTLPLGMGVTNGTNSFNGVRNGSVVIGNRQFYTNGTTVSGNLFSFTQMPHFSLF